MTMLDIMRKLLTENGWTEMDAQKFCDALGNVMEDTKQEAVSKAIDEIEHLKT